MSEAEREACEAELASDPELQQLYEAVVVQSGALSPAEFWAQRRHKLRAKMQAAGFERGAPDRASRLQLEEELDAATF
eukprot:2495473-Prymnesium_polylepis.1